VYALEYTDPPSLQTSFLCLRVKGREGRDEEEAEEPLQEAEAAAVRRRGRAHGRLLRLHLRGGLRGDVRRGQPGRLPSRNHRVPDGSHQHAHAGNRMSRSRRSV